MGFIIGLILGTLITAYVTAVSLVDIEREVYLRGFQEGQAKRMKDDGK